jgi:hypothetical protein
MRYQYWLPTLVGCTTSEAEAETKRFFETILSHAILVLGRAEVMQIVRSATKRKRQPNSDSNGLLLAEWDAYRDVRADKGEKENKIEFCRAFRELYCRTTLAASVEARLNRLLRSRKRLSVRKARQTKRS